MPVGGGKALAASRVDRFYDLPGIGKGVTLMHFTDGHALAPRGINVGNVGPSLTGYGLQRSSSEAVAKLTYERIYNGWAYAPCSSMPRLGANGHLAPEQIAHVVAYLIDPQPPVNRK